MSHSNLLTRVTRRLTHVVPVLACAGLLPATLMAQGSLSTFGFGYPVNGMSTRVSGTAGAFGEIDPLSPINPGAIGGTRNTVLSAQAEPEHRTLTFGSVREKTSSQRIPLLAMIFPAGKGVAVGVSARGFLDRSYTTTTTGSAIIDGNTLPTNEQLIMRGSIGDIRTAIGWQIGTWARVGVGGHIFTGENTAVRERTFADTLQFGSTLDSSRVTYFGTALSLGGEVRLFKGMAAAASYRAGNSFEARIRDTTRASGSVPARLGGTLRYDGIPGSTFAVGFEQVKWSDMRGMASSRTTASDALNYYGGAEVAGPRMRGVPVLVRVGYARNELPFSASAARVNETRFSGGLGLPIAREAASLDFSIQRANRALAGTATKESAWLLGIGLQIRP
jgi:hypothetical protein